MGASVRKIYYNELGQLLELYRHLNEEDPDISGEKGTLELWDRIVTDPGQKIFVVEEDGKLVASCTLILVPNLTRGGKPYALIENVVTHADYRKRGFGRAVLEKAAAAAREAGCYKVMLMTGRKDDGVMTFYEKAGFDRGMKTAFCTKFQ
jgi:GNAT superfamily N-acetyltransferase